MTNKYNERWIRGQIPIIESDKEKHDLISYYFNKERTIYLSGGIEFETSTIIIQQLMALYSLSLQPIIMYISSPGGSAYACQAMVDIMDVIKKSCIIKTVAYGFAASAGSVIVSNGTKGHRYGFSTTDIMIHHSNGGMQGSYLDMVVEFEQTKKLNQWLIDYYVRVTDQSKDIIQQALQRDKYFTVPEAIEFGLLDKVFDATSS
jgi:ATP-dependent Clp protease protease subunit